MHHDVFGDITYDADGQQTGLTDGTGNWVWTYDSLHRLTSVIEGDNGTVAVVEERNGVRNLLVDGQPVAKVQQTWSSRVADVAQPDLPR